MDTAKLTNSEWHTKEIPTLLAELSTTENGLTQGEAARRLDEHGPNELISADHISPWTVFANQFKNAYIPYF